MEMMMTEMRQPYLHQRIIVAIEDEEDVFASTSGEEVYDLQKSKEEQVKSSSLKEQEEKEIMIASRKRTIQRTRSTIDTSTMMSTSTRSLPLSNGTTRNEIKVTSILKRSTSFVGTECSSIGQNATFFDPEGHPRRPRSSSDLTPDMHSAITSTSWSGQTQQDKIYRERSSSDLSQLSVSFHETVDFSKCCDSPKSTRNTNSSSESLVLESKESKISCSSSARALEPEGQNRTKHRQQKKKTKLSRVFSKVGL